MQHYTEEEKRFIFENYTKMQISEIAHQLGRKSNAIHLFLHRNANDKRMVMRENLLFSLLKTKFKDPSLFAPNRQFLDAVRIGQKRYWALYKGLEVMTNEECIRIADYLDISLDGVFLIHQLQLFEAEPTK